MNIMPTAASNATTGGAQIRYDLVGSTEDPETSTSTLHVDNMGSDVSPDKPKIQRTPQTKSPQRLRNGRIIRLMIFLALEFVWLGLGLFIRYVVAPASSTIVTGTRLTVAAMVWESRLFSVVIFLHTLIVFPMADLINEIYSGEWWWIFKKIEKLETSRYDDPEVGRISTLVSGRWEQFKHAFFGGHATLSYRLGFIMALLLLALQSVAPVAITTSYYPFPHDKQLVIGLLPPNLTPSDNTGTSDSFNQTSQSTANQLALKVVRFEYVVQAENHFPDFSIVNKTSRDWLYTLLFGFPTRNVTDLFDGSIDSISYKSDAVAYNFSCQWLAPTLVQASLPITWSFGGDMEGVIDFQSVLTTVTVPASYGIYPLAITSGSGATNGSFAWFIFGLTDQSDLDSDLEFVSQDLGVFLDFSSFSVSEKNVSNTDWAGIATGITLLGDAFSTTATVLFCDPDMRLGGVDILVRDFGSTLVVDNFVENTTVGNLDRTETERMLGQSLNGIPWDSVVVIANNTPSSLSQLAAELLFTPSQDDIPTFFPRDLSKIGADLNSYTLTAGMTAYLDGSSKSTTVDAITFTDILALDINWTQWIMTLVFVLIIAVLVIVLTVHDSKERRCLVPFTLDVLREEYLPRVPVQQEKV